MPRHLIGFAVVAACLASTPTSSAYADCVTVSSTTAAQRIDHDGRTRVISGSVTLERICNDRNAPAPVSGGGDGGSAPCVTRPLGDLAQVEAVWAAVTAEQAPDPADPNYTEDVANPAGTRFDEVMFDVPWFRSRGGQYQVAYGVRCPGSPEVTRWVTVVPDSAGNFVPQVRAIDLVASLHAEVVRRLPTPELRVMPSDEDAGGFAYVQNRTFFWVQQGAGQWETVSGSTSAGGISVTVQAVPVRLVVNPGDGSESVVCDGAPLAVTKATYYPEIEGCSFIYRHSSATARNGETFPVIASIVWHATWSASTGEGGDLGYLSTTSDVRELAVAEIQALIINQDP